MISVSHMMTSLNGKSLREKTLRVPKVTFLYGQTRQSVDDATYNDAALNC